MKPENCNNIDLTNEKKDIPKKKIIEANLNQLLKWRWGHINSVSLHEVCDRLKTVCPHERIVDDYIDLDCERGGVYIKYCESCYTTWNQ